MQPHFYRHFHQLLFLINKRSAIKTELKIAVEGNVRLHSRKTRVIGQKHHLGRYITLEKMDHNMLIVFYSK